MTRSIYNSDRTLVCYDDNGTEIILASCLADPTDLDALLDICNIDMDAYAEENDWSGWDYDCLYSRPDYAEGFDWRAYQDGDDAGDCWGDDAPTVIRPVKKQEDIYHA